MKGVVMEGERVLLETPESQFLPPSPPSVLLMMMHIAMGEVNLIVS